MMHDHAAAVDDEFGRIRISSLHSFDGEMM